MLQESLKKYREEKGFSKTKLAELSGLNRNTVKDLENGIVLNPSLDTLKALAKALKIDITDLLK